MDRPEPPYDEMYAPDGRVRPHYAAYSDWLVRQPDDALRQKRAEADSLFHRVGITFAVYGEQEGNERLIPFDIVPRVLSAQEWRTLAAGLRQRVRALNAFVADIYHEQDILRAAVIAPEQIYCNPQYRPEMQGMDVPGGIYAHIAGIDVVRAGPGEFYVLEDNLRCPSGVSYVLENREVMKRTFPQVFDGLRVTPIEDYSERLLDTLLHTAPQGVESPTVALLTPGIYNSAYFEHSFLAQQMGVELVEGRDLVVVEGLVYMRTTQGLKRIDVIYRRIDDDFLDPTCFQSDSLLGVPHLMEAYRRGNVTLANAPGTGIADDKAVYAFVPQIIRYYLGEDPVLPNVPTFVCADPIQCDHVLAHLHELVVKPTNESGGYGILMGPQASAAERALYVDLIRANPRNYIAQPMLTLSTVPTIVDDHLEARHVDLRPFVLHGQQTYVLPGGLTRVALRKGSMIVNSSQGGGSKDTWVLMESSHTGNGSAARHLRPAVDESLTVST